ncbi:hypothetical protein [Sphingobacterium sp. LRF_L2]|uniref:hypothetical protein n=1 Tax=Sphingobacterium sp. LRF_L2 TaxID=3369421 RepID=UPI003F63E428
MENQGRSVAYLYHQALVNPNDLTADDFGFLLAKFPYSQPLHFAFERRKFLQGELNNLGGSAILLSASPNWLYEYVQMPVVESPFVEVQDDDYVPYKEGSLQELTGEITDVAIDSAPIVEEAVLNPSNTDLSNDAIDFDVVVTDELVVAETEDTQEESNQQQEASGIEEESVFVTEEDNVDVEEAPLDAVISSSELQEQHLENVEETDVDVPIVEREEARPDEEAKGLSVGLDSVHTTEDEDERNALETLVIEGIGGGDYFALHAKNLQWENEKSEDIPEEIVSGEEEQENKEEDDISLYNDDLMPYSFRWWLHKTRLEYAETYQPFVNPSLTVNKKSGFDPIEFDRVVLDQQIRENIIHFQSPEDKLSEEVKQRTVDYNRNDKTAEVIERFIREEPQIQPPPADQLNMENKARKSSEEKFELVTETLAHIYAGQAMYVKAIEVFKKLILKFPEKKSYFASRIKELEEKLY